MLFMPLVGPLFIYYSYFSVFPSASVYDIILSYGIKKIPSSYKRTLLINYVLNQSFTIIFFIMKNNFLGFVSCLLTLISTLFLYEETSLLKNKKKYISLEDLDNSNSYGQTWKIYLSHNLEPGPP